jgi:hypothetical protein
MLLSGAVGPWFRAGLIGAVYLLCEANKPRAWDIAIHKLTNEALYIDELLDRESSHHKTTDKLHGNKLGPHAWLLGYSR